MAQAFWTDRRSNGAGALALAFFNWLASFFVGGRNNLERTRKRALKRIAKTLAAHEQGKFFRVKSMEATPELAQFFYEICRVIAPAREPLQHVEQSTQAKIAAVERFLEPGQGELLEQLSAESITKRAEETEEGLLARQLQDELADLERSFDPDQTNAINECYQMMLHIGQFVAYDYYFLLKKFDLQLTEQSFGRQPVFVPIRGEAVAEELKDFLDLTGDLDPNRDWSVPLLVLKELKGIEAIPFAEWSRMLFMIRELANADIFALIIRLVEKDPEWVWERPAAAERENLAGWYLELVREETRGRLELILTAKRNVLIEQHAKAVFGNKQASRLNYYTEAGGEAYASKNFPGFADAKALSYLMLFLTDKQPELQNCYELILIRGRWASMPMSFPLSDALWLLGLFPARITALDEMLSDWGFYGVKLRTAMLNFERDKNTERSIVRYLDSLNSEARQIVNDAIFNLSVLRDGLKVLREDCRRIPGNIIRNWEELNHFSEAALENRLLALWNMLTHMLELLRVLLK
ncbi:MAG: hypothetical protein LBK63_00880 [Treponema sp.]|nr:hypothetical protein [Treponema sp.]